MSRSRQLHFTQVVLVFMCLFSISGSCMADVAVIVHPESATNELTPRQVKKLFLGRMHMFPSTNIEAVPIDQKESQRTYSVFYSDLIGMTPVKLKRYRAAYLFSGKGRLPLEVDSDLQVRSYIAGNRSAIGYIDASLLDESVKVVYLLVSE